MKTSKQKIEEEKDLKSSEETLDPFAVDFFGVLDSENSETGKLSETNGKGSITQKLNLTDVKGLDWHQTLPKLSAKEAEFSNLLSELPNVLSEAAHESVKKTFSRFTFLSKKAIHCEILSVTEVNLKNSLKELDKTSQIFLTLECNPSSQSSIIAINAEFASSLIDLVLGGKGETNETLRPLSTVEQTIVEFLAINIFGELNNNLADTKFRLKSVTNDVNTTFGEFERGAEVILDFIFARLSGSVTILLPTDFLSEMGNTNKSLFLKNSPIQKLKKFSKFASELDLKVQLGETTLHANDLPFLEKDDVVLVEKPSLFNNQTNKVFIGDGKNVCLKGILQTQAIEAESADLSNELSLAVQEIVSVEETRIQPRREKMATKPIEEKKKDTEETVEQEVESQSKETFVKENSDRESAVEEEIEVQSQEDEIDNEAISTLENVMVNLRVQIGGKRLSLKELQKVRVGQIIELGCNPNDPVEIVTDSDNKPIATGELLEIEGELGVRLTKIFV